MQMEKNWRQAMKKRIDGEILVFAESLKKFFKSKIMLKGVFNHKFLNSNLSVLGLEEGPVVLIAHPVVDNLRPGPVDHPVVLPLHAQQHPVGCVRF
jgi:hypothetical protein